MQIRILIWFGQILFMIDSSWVDDSNDTFNLYVRHLGRDVQAIKVSLFQPYSMQFKTENCQSNIDSVWFRWLTMLRSTALECTILTIPHTCMYNT